VNSRKAFSLIGGVLIVLGVASASFGFLGYLAESHAVQRYSCDSPLPQDEAARINQDQLPVVDIELFPIALTCTWIREDGSQYTQRWDRWGTTLFIYGGALVSVTGILLVALPRVRKRST
jgi:hypothetical protein